MRICYASADFGISVFGDKGASVHIQAMVQAFSELGHEVCVVAPQMGNSPASYHATLKRARTLPPVISAQDLALAVHSDRVLKERRNIAAGKSVEAAILEEHNSKPFDFIYERQSLWSAAAVRASRLLNIPAVLEINSPLLEEQQTYRRLVLEAEARGMETENYLEADLIFTVSDEVRSYVLKHGANSASTFVQENGVDTNLFDTEGPVAPTPFPATTPVIGFSGSLKQWHGLEDLLTAFAILHRQNVKCGLLIAGDGPMRSWVEGFARGAGIEALVHVTGWIPHDDIPAAIRRMDIATAPYPNLEGFYFSPLKLFEYMACGRAVVASKIGQVSKIVTDGATGILSVPGNPRDLADRIALLVQQPEQRLRLGQAARDAVQGRTWTKAAERIATMAQSLQLTALQRSA